MKEVFLKLIFHFRFLMANNEYFLVTRDFEKSRIGF